MGRTFISISSVFKVSADTSLRVSLARADMKCVFVIAPSQIVFRAQKRAPRMIIVVSATVRLRAVGALTERGAVGALMVIGRAREAVSARKSNGRVACPMSVRAKSSCLALVTSSTTCFEVAKFLTISF